MLKPIGIDPTVPDLEEATDGSDIVNLKIMDFVYDPSVTASDAIR